MLYPRAFIAAGIALSIAGCSGAGSPLTPPGSIAAPSVSQDATKAILYVADRQGNVVRMYDPNTPNPTAEGEITDGISGPQGLAVDSKGTLYVSNVGGSTTAKNWISIYDAGKKKPRMTIPGPGYYGLAVDAKGDIFATFTGGYVAAYKPGAKKPYETFKGFDNLDGIAVDSKDNVWFADIGASKVYEILAGTRKAKDAGLSGLNGPDGVAFGPKDTLYVANFGPYNVQVYKAGSKHPAYTLTDGIHQCTLNGATAGGIFFQSNQTDNVVGYKAGQKAPFSTITGNSDPLGIAAYPPVRT
jgi:sugar lactone lactonase YvrE